MALTSGERLGSYEIADLIGAGGMGEVYRATDTTLKREVAIKVLPQSFASDAGRMARFRQEAEVLASFNHLNIAQIYGLEIGDGISAIVMEFIDGPTLADRILEGPIPVAEALAIATQIAEAIEAAHDRGIVHRDLKPANVKLRPDGVVKVLDFGIAKVTEPATTASSGGSPVLTTPAMTETGMILGTVSYMSPEQARGKPLDKRTDIWAFGAVLYEMLTGQPPFLGEDVTETVAAVLKSEPDWSALPELPPLVAMFLRQCLRKDPKERIHDVADIRLALTGSYDTAAAIPLAQSQAPRNARASSAGWIVGAIAGLAALGSGIAYWRGTTDPDAPMLTPYQLSYRHGKIGSARFATDEQEIIFGAAFDDEPYRIFRTRRDSFQPRLMAEAPAADLLSVSSSNLLALSIGRPPANGWFPLERLAEMDLYGGAPGPLDNGNVVSFDYGPDGQVAAIVRRVGNESVLEFPVGTEVHRSGHIGRARISPDGDRVCFTNFYTALMTAEPAGSAELTLDRLSRITGCAWSPTGKEILFAQSSPPFAIHYNIEAVRLDGQDRRVLGAYTSYVEIQDVAADGAILIAAGATRFSALARSAGGRDRDLSIFDASRVTSLNGAGTHLLMFDNGVGAGANGLFIRPMDGSPYRELSGVGPLALSNDASRVAIRGVTATGGPSLDTITLITVETGEAETFQLDFEFPFLGNILGRNVWDVAVAEFSDDGRRLLVPYASKAGEPHRAYVYDFEEERSYAATPEGITGPVILSPDGELVASNEVDGLHVYSVENGEGRLVPGGPDQLLPARWSKDENLVFLIEPRGAGATIVERDLTTGSRRVRGEVRAADEAGVTLFDLRLARDGETYAYTVNRMLTDLYLLEGYVEPE